MKQFARVPFGADRFPFFYGWWIVGMGTLGIVMSIPGQTIGVSTFTDSLLDALGMNRDTLSLAYMCGTITSSLILTKAGKLYDRYGARPIAITASFGLGVALLYMSQVDKILQFFIHDAQTTPVVLTFIAILFGFLLMRFFGQGVLTLASRTMMMKWFDTKRGFAMGFSNVAISLLFSMAPVLYEYLIQQYGWRSAWQFTALVLIFIFPIIIFVFFRNDPTDVGLVPDGQPINPKAVKNHFPVKQDFTLEAARKTLSFWVVTGLLAMQGLYITGFTFHVVSIFAEAGLSRATAISVFQPTAITAVIFTLGFSWIADKTKVKYLIYIMSLGGGLACTGMIILDYTIGFYLLVFGNAFMMSLFGVVNSIAMPRFFGKQHLGAIIGQVMTVVVFGSAIGPYLMSSSLSYTGSYWISGLVCMVCFLSLGIAAIYMKNPQEELMD